MQAVRITNASGVDDVKLVAENESERMWLRQLAEAGTLVSRSTNAGTSLVFRALSVANAAGDSLNSLISRGEIGRLDFKLRQNQNFTIGLTFINAGDPMDLTAYATIKLQIKSKANGATLVSLAIGTGLTVSGDDNNVLTIAVTPGQSVLLTNDEYDYDILMSTESSNTYFIKGIITIERTGTR